MTPNEFTAWLDGFLDGKDSLTADQIGTLRAKAEKLTPLKSIDWGVGGARMKPDDNCRVIASPIGNVAYTRAEN